MGKIELLDLTDEHCLKFVHHLNMLPFF
ncbi:hypothetical protein [Paenibacillus sp. A3]|nr:hypothetical protein [Paenibacillus sp. A3]